jgi:uridine kinase
MNQEKCRSIALYEIAKKILELPSLGHPIRIGVDGGSASGKTVFADELAKVLKESNRHIIRAGLDGFHNPPEIRYQKGPMSVEGYVEDSFDYNSVQECILSPMGPGGNLKFSREVYCHHAESEQAQEWEVAEKDAILIFEGVMLFRTELIDGFDYKIKIYTSPEVKLERAKVRDLEKFGSMEKLLEKYTKRFLPGQAMYREKYHPLEIADVVVHNDDPANPVLAWKEKSGSYPNPESSRGVSPLA